MEGFLSFVGAHINEIIVLSTGFAAYLYLNTIGRLSVAVYCAAVLIYDFIGYYIPDAYGSYYYLLAALTDLFIIYQLSKITKPTKTTIIVQMGCLAFIVNNFMGWVIFMYRWPSITYVVSSTLIYAAIFIFIITGYKNGSINMDRSRPSIRLFNRKSIYAMSNYEKKARN